MLGKLRRPLLTLLVFALIGPLIGLVVFSLGLGVLVVVGGRPDGWRLTPFFLIYGVVFAHFVGLLWALLAGAVAAILAHFYPERQCWIGPVSGLASFTVAFMTGAARFPLTAGTVAQVARDGLSIGITMIVLATFVLSAALCWAIARRL